MESRNSIARLAGGLYLLVVVSGIFSLMYVPKSLVVWEDASQTVSNLNTSISLFQIGAVVELFCYAIFLFLPLVLYRLFESTNRSMTLLMVILVIVAVPISCVAVANKFEVISLLGDSRYLEVLTLQEIEVRVMLALKSYSNGIHVAQVFWGLWLVPFGLLVYRSQFLPRILGIFLIAGGFGYLISFVGVSLFSSYRGSMIATVVDIPSAIGEIGSCLWLLILGARPSLFRRE